MDGFSERLHHAMKKAGYSQSSLAQQLGLTQPQIHYYLKGHSRPRPIIRQKLAYELKVNYHWLAWGWGKCEFYEREYPFEQFLINFPEKLIFLFWMNNRTVVEVAELLNISYNEIEYFMEGIRYPTYEKAIALCKLFGVNNDYLIDGFEVASKAMSEQEWLKLNHSLLKR